MCRDFARFMTLVVLKLKLQVIFISQGQPSRQQKSANVCKIHLIIIIYLISHCWYNFHLILPFDLSLKSVANIKEAWAFSELQRPQQPAWRLNHFIQPYYYYILCECCFTHGEFCKYITTTFTTILTTIITPNLYSCKTVNGV